MRSLLTVVCTLFVAGAATAQDPTITTRSSAKPFKAPIKSESGLGIVVLMPKETTISSDDIVDIEYPITPFEAKLKYNEALKKEKDAGAEGKEKDRKALLYDAQSGYEEALKKAAPDPKSKRHLEFKAAMTRARLYLENNFGAPDNAIQKLEEFRVTNADGWQINQAMLTLARLYQNQKDYKKAQKVFSDWSGLKVAPDHKSEAEYQAAMAFVDQGSPKEAATALKTLEAKLPKENRYSQKARVAQAECLALAKQMPEANKILRQIIKDTTDKNLKAMAYNTLGKNLYDVGQLKEARWEFLWVDVVFSQDKAEHAKSLYYLWQIFNKLGEPERAIECRDQLMDRQFAASEYQLRAKSGQ